MIVEDKAFDDSEINSKKGSMEMVEIDYLLLSKVKGTQQIASKSSFPRPHVLRIDKKVQFMGSLHENVGK